jgi:uncharacterized protein YeaO (DUF488 family)
MPSSLAKIRVKRAYDPPEKEDGVRVLVDRIWPRGLTKRELHVTTWLRDLAPSNEVRKWFHANFERCREFRRKYLLELRSLAAAQDLKTLHELASSNRALTLVFASKQLECNNATVLKEFTEENWKDGAKAVPNKLRRAR